MKTYFKSAVAASALLFAMESTYAANLCSNLFAQEGPAVSKVKSLTVNTSALDLKNQTRIYPKGVDPKKNPEGYMQFSYESEYLFSEAGPLLNDYAPAPSVMPHAKWFKMSSQERIEWIKDKFGDKPEFATAAGLYKVSKDRFLPDELIVDSTGNLEIVINPPLSSYKQLSYVVRSIVKKYGPGSQQAMLSKPRESAFTKTAGNAALRKQHLGWLVYTNQFDMYQKLISGAERYKKDPSKLTALSFDHPFLGPMTDAKRKTLESYIYENAQGRKYDDASKQYVRKSDASYKYTSGPSYRPDIAGPVRWAWEIRNAHKDVEDLMNKVERDMIAHVKGLDVYAAFAEVPAFDSVRDFNRFSPHIKDMLKELFPSKADPRFNYTAEEHIALESYRNFSMPVSDLSKLTAALEPSVTSRNSLNTKVGRARIRYLNTLESVSSRLKNGTITAAQAKADVMGALGLWSQQTGLNDAFEGFARRAGHDPKYIENQILIGKAG